MQDLSGRVRPDKLERIHEALFDKLQDPDKRPDLEPGTRRILAEVQSNMTKLKNSTEEKQWEVIEKLGMARRSEGYSPAQLYQKLVRVIQELEETVKTVEDAKETRKHARHSSPSSLSSAN